MQLPNKDKPLISFLRQRAEHGRGLDCGETRELADYLEDVTRRRRLYLTDLKKLVLVVLKDMPE